MIRERALKVVLILEGLLFLAAIYPISMNIWNQALDGGVMMLSIYFAMGIFLLAAVRSPASHRSLILFAGCANIAHALVMAVMAVRFVNERTFLLEMIVFCVLVGVPLIALAPAKHSSTEKVAVAAAR
ncbi:MAG: DUF6632 domain-containing protein [Acidobacteriaceae bacterium]